MRPRTCVGGFALRGLENLPIRWRLTLFIALVIGVILLVLGFALYLLSRDALLEGVEETVQSRAENVRRHIQDGELLKSREDARNADPRIIQDGVTLIVRNESSDALLKINFPAKAKANDKPVWRRVINSDKPTDDVVMLAGDPYYVYAVPVDPPKGPARVVLTGKTYEWAEDAIEVVATWLAIGFGAAFLLSIGGAYLLAGTALKPVAAVTSAASKMGEGDLSKRLPVANPNDEIGRLTTTINALLARLEVAFRRLEETLSRQRRFAADASHELRTPLTSISGHARMLDEWALEGDKQTAQRSVGTIRREAGRMRGLVESLLTLTRGDEGAPMEVGRYDLGAVAKEATQTAGAAADGRVSVEFVPNEHEITATFDRERVLQVASILLDNAVKFTPEGGSVKVRGEEEDGSVALSVSDTGVGISEDQLPLVFERFYRADPSRSAGGAGLGLSIARQIAEAHGGQIRAESTPGKGSTFTLLLPRNGPGYLTSERPTEPSAE